jgi:hypothetical protein
LIDRARQEFDRKREAEHLLRLLGYADGLYGHGGGGIDTWRHK